MAGMSAAETTPAKRAGGALPKKILIDGQNLALPRGTGIATYSRQLMAVHAELGITVDAFIASEFSPRNDPLYNRREFDLGTVNLPLVPGSRFARRIVRAAGQAFGGLRLAPIDQTPPFVPDSALGRLASMNRTLIGCDVFHAARQHAFVTGQMLPLKLAPEFRPDMFHAMQIAPMAVPGRPCIATIHDIIPVVLDGATKEPKKLFRRIVGTIVKHADHIVTVSEHSRQDLIRYFGADEKRVTNTYQTVRLPEALVARSHAEIDNDLANYDLEQGSYFIFLGAIEPKKNVKRLVEAFAASGSKRRLIMVGGLGWDYDEDLKAINDERFTMQKRRPGTIQRLRQVRHLSFVPFADLISLLRGARALLFPSLYEGFGLPVAEALSLGVPVMTSNTSSLPEIAGDAALKIDPLQVTEMARAIRTLDHDDALCAELAKRGPLQAAQFSHEAHRAKIEAVYRSVM
jgi:glycosyltransferase involved in cell wall biosynthesis